MPENENVQAPETEPQKQQDPAPEPASTDQEAAEPHGDQRDWKASSRKWEQRSKENHEAAVKAQEETEHERMRADSERERADRASADLAAATRRIAVLETARAEGVDAALLERMTGETADEIADNARAIKAAMAGARAYPDVPDRGQPSPVTTTREQIESIKDPVDRVKARAEHMNLYR